MNSNPFFVVSDARKVIFRVFPGEIVSFPDGAVINQWGNDSETPNIVVENGTDHTWQGASAEKEGYVIFNEIPEDVALAMIAIWEGGFHLGGNSGLESVVRYAAELGYVDCYTTNQEFVDTKLSPAGYYLPELCSGIVKRDDRDMTPLKKEGGVILVNTQGNWNVIQPDILLRTYRMPDGSPIDIDQILEEEVR